MGSCSSSLNCDTCFAPNSESSKCTSEIEVNADIAGYGVLVAFYISAWLLSIVVVWGWLRNFLPSDLLTSTDQYFVRCMRNPRKPFNDSDIQTERTVAQEKTQALVTSFAKMLGDQQLVTGIAILTAGLASRCDTSLLEFNIVTCLAYLCTFTHLLSLEISRDYLYTHKSVRTWRVALTVCFFIMFCFSYTVNTVNYDADLGSTSRLSSGNAFQCVFEAHNFDKSVKISSWYSITLLGALLYSHTLAIWNLFQPPDTDAVSGLFNRLMTFAIRKTIRSQKERDDIVHNAIEKYYAWLRPSKTDKQAASISLWYIFESYFDAFASSIPGIFAGMSYGTVSTVQAIWSTGFEISGLNNFGFGQVVAITLLALTALAVMENINEQEVLARIPKQLDDLGTLNSDSISSSYYASTVDAISSIRTRPLQKWFVKTGVQKSDKELYNLATMQTAPEDYEDNSTVSRRLAKACFRIWVFHVCIYTYAGLACNFIELEYSVVILMLMWTGLRVLLVAKRIINQMYFVKLEADIRANGQRQTATTSQQNLVHASHNTSAASILSGQTSGPSSQSRTTPAMVLPLDLSSTEGNTNELSTPSARTASGMNLLEPGNISYRGTFPFIPRSEISDFRSDSRLYETRSSI